jgi:hypothetical protein
VLHCGGSGDKGRALQKQTLRKRNSIDFEIIAPQVASVDTFKLSAITFLLLQLKGPSFLISNDKDLNKGI